MLLKSLASISGFNCHVLVGRSRDDLCELAQHLLELGVAEIVLERIDDGTVNGDARVLNKLAERHEFEWRHEIAAHEPLLWISDLVVSAYGAGGMLRTAVEPVVAANIRPQ